MLMIKRMSEHTGWILNLSEEVYEDSETRDEHNIIVAYYDDNEVGDQKNVIVTTLLGSINKLCFSITVIGEEFRARVKKAIEEESVYDIAYEIIEDELRKKPELVFRVAKDAYESGWTKAEYQRQQALEMDKEA